MKNDKTDISIEIEGCPDLDSMNVSQAQKTLSERVKQTKKRERIQKN